MNPKKYEFESIIWRDPDRNSSYVIFPYDIKEEFGKGKVRVAVTFDGEPYECSIVNRGFTNKDGSVCYTVNLRYDLMRKIGKIWGDTVQVTVQEIQ